MAKAEGHEDGRELQLPRATVEPISSFHLAREKGPAQSALLLPSTAFALPLLLPSCAEFATYSALWAHRAVAAEGRGFTNSSLSTFTFPSTSSYTYTVALLPSTSISAKLGMGCSTMAL